MLIQIVPQLPPVANGLGDYGLAVARKLHRDFGITTCFVVGDPNWTGATVLEDFPIKKIAERSAKALSSVLSEIASTSSSILLNYVGYGYARRGCPVWLIEGLRQWQKEAGRSTLVTMFHEVFASGPPWTSAFWLSSLQKQLATRLVKISDHVITNKPLYAEVLRQLCPSKKFSIPIMPVFSNIGEPEIILPLAERTPRLIVFGCSDNRLKVYEQSLSALKRICRELSIQEVIDIGPPIDLPIFEVNDIPIVALGQQPAEKISVILQDSWVGFFNYPLDFLARSGIFAAYCAHGVIPVGTSYYIWGQEKDGLEANKHYWLADSQAEELSLSVGQAITDQAYAWYRDHSLSKHTEVLLDKLFY